MEFTEEVETVLPAGYTIGKSKKSSSRGRESSSSSRTTEKTVGSSSKGGLFSRGRGISKKFSKIRQYARSRSRSLSRERFNTAREKFNTKRRQLTKSTTPKKKNISSPSPESNATQKETSTAASKTITEDRRDTEEAPSSSEPTRDGSPAPPTECSLTVGSADSQSQPTVSDNDDSTIIDTTSLYGRITGVLSTKKSNNEEVKEEGAATTPVESLFSAAAALVRGQSGVSVSSKKKDTNGKGSISSEEDVKSKAATPVESLPFATVALVKGQSGVSVSSKKKDTSGKGSISSEEDVKSEPTKQDTEAATSVESLPFAAVALGRGQSGVSVSSKKSTSSKRSIRSKKSVKSEPAKQGTEEEATPAQDEIIEQAQEEEAVVAKPEKEPAAAGHTWAKNISLKVGGFQTSFQMVDPVATITGKVNEVMNGFDSELVKQAEALEYKDEERDYDENPTKLFLLLQQKAWGLAMAQLEKHPEEAEVWVYRKFVPEKAPNVHDASDPEKSQALVKQTTALSTVVNAPVKYRWRLLPLHASIVLGAPQEVTTKILQTYPEAARKVDERGSLPVHLAASRLDVDQEGEKVVLQLFGVYADSIDITDRRGRTAPELAKLARARKAAEKQRLMETASRASRTSRACIETSASKNWREEEEEEEETDDDDDDDRSVKSSFSTRFRNMMKGSKSMDRGDRKKSKRGDLENVKSNGDDDSIVADIEGMAPGFAFLTVAKSTEERDAQTIANEVIKAQSKQLISEEYKTSAEGLTEVPTDALELPLPASKSFGDGSVKSTKSVGSTKSGGSVKSTKSGGSTKSGASVKFTSSEPEVDASVAPMADDSTVSDDSSVVSTVVESLAASTDPQAALRALLEKACENAGRQGLDVTKFLVVLEEEWVTDVEAIRRLDGATLDSILPIMLSREVQRLVNHSNNVDGEYLKRTRGRSHGRKNKPSKFSKKKSKRRSARRKPAPRLNLDPIHEEDNNDGTDNTPINTPIIEEEEEEEDETTYNSGSVALTEGEDNTVTDNTDDDESVPSFTSASCTEKGFVDEDLMRKNHAALILEARHRFPTREALEDAIRERQATVSLAVGSGFDVDKQTLAQAALADDEVRKLLPLRLVLPSVADLKEMAGVLQAHKETALRSFDVEKALRIQIEVDEIQTQIDEEEKYLRRKSFSQTSCTKCGANFETKKKMVGILKQKEMVCDNCRDMPEV